MSDNLHWWSYKTSTIRKVPGNEHRTERGSVFECQLCEALTLRPTARGGRGKCPGNKGMKGKIV